MFATNQAITLEKARRMPPLDVGIECAFCDEYVPSGHFLVAKHSLESIVPNLVESKTFIDLAIAKPTGLNDLGAPLTDSAVVKKGKLHEYAQNLEDGKVGRMFQNLRAIGIKTMEGSAESSKIFFTFEAFGDGNKPQADEPAFRIDLYAGDEKLLELAPSRLFLPYAFFWYDNRFVFGIPNELFDRADRIEFVALPNAVDML